MEREKLVCNLTCCFRASEFTGTTTLTDTALRSDRAEDWNKQRGKCYAVLANVQGTGSCDSVTVWHRLWRCDSFDFSHLRSNWCYDDGSFTNKPVSFESQLWVVVVFFLWEPDMIGVWHRWPAEHFTPERWRRDAEPGQVWTLCQTFWKWTRKRIHIQCRSWWRFRTYVCHSLFYFLFVLQISFFILTWCFCWCVIFTCTQLY